MMSAESLRRQIDEITSYLIEVGLAGDYNGIFRRTLNAHVEEVTFSGAVQLNAAMKDRPYEDIYDHFDLERAYVLKFPDGALIQMSYLMRDAVLERHRLAFLPSPRLRDFQSDPDVYIEEHQFADNVGRHIVPFPLRFDFDARDEVRRELVHPTSHLSLGQYKECRIPVTAAITPYRFIDFILRNFYQTSETSYSSKLPVFTDCFDDCIHPTERSVVHVALPK